MNNSTGIKKGKITVKNFKACVKSRVANSECGVQLGSKSEILSGSPTLYKCFSFYDYAILAGLKMKRTKIALLESHYLIFKPRITLSTLQAPMLVAATIHLNSGVFGGVLPARTRALLLNAFNNKGG